MSLRMITALSAALIGFSVQAQDGAAPLTRDQVRAEFFQARAAGQLPGYGEVNGSPEIAAKGRPLTRAEVLKDLRDSGPLAYGEGSDIGANASVGHELTRSEVRAAARQALRAGELKYGEM